MSTYRGFLALGTAVIAGCAVPFSVTEDSVASHGGNGGSGGHAGMAGSAGQSSAGSDGLGGGDSAGNGGESGQSGSGGHGGTGGSAGGAHAGQAGVSGSGGKAGAAGKGGGSAGTAGGAGKGAAGSGGGAAGSGGSGGAGECVPSTKDTACGPCAKGTRTCTSGGTWGVCTGDPPETAMCGTGTCTDGTSTCGGPCVGNTQNLGAMCNHCGTIQCGGACSPADPPGWGGKCSDCGGALQCDGSCMGAVNNHCPAGWTQNGTSCSFTQSSNSVDISQNCNVSLPQTVGSASVPFDTLGGVLDVTIDIQWSAGGCYDDSSANGVHANCSPGSAYWDGHDAGVPSATGGKQQTIDGVGTTCTFTSDNTCWTPSAQGSCHRTVTATWTATVGVGCY